MRNKKLHSWQRHDWQALQLLLSRRPNVLLVSYTKGGGEDCIADCVIQFSLCLCAGAKANCDCSSCRYFVSDMHSHPDLCYLKLSKKNKGGVDSIRNELESTRLAPHVSKNRLIVIEHAHDLTPSAQNALLKALEESQGRHFVLLTHQVDSLLPTLRSRAVKYNLSMPSKEQFVSYMSQYATEKQISLLWKLTGGMPILAKKWLDKHYLELYKTAIGCIKQLLLLTRCPIEASQQCSKIEPDILSSIVLSWWRDVIIWRMTKLQGKTSTQLQSLFKKTELSVLHRCYQLTIEYTQSNNTGINPILNIENMFLSFVKEMYNN